MTPSPASTEAMKSEAQKQKLLPVTVLSGFLGAGKTTLLKHVLRSAHVNERNMKIAVLVNDMGEINLDASEIKNSRLIQEEATMVELHNGCICCTLRGDLLKTVKSLSEEKAFDYLVIESTGISEPLPVAQTFVMDVDDVEEGKLPSAVPNKDKKGPLNSLSNYAQLDTMVTVVDALNVYDIFGSLETLAEKNATGMIGNSGVVDKDQDTRSAKKEEPQVVCKDHNHEHDEEEEVVDDRSIAQLMLDQIEFANVILLSKAHLVKSEKAVAEITALLKLLSPGAKVIVPQKPHFADLVMDEVLNTKLFDMEKAETSKGWILELAKDLAGKGHTPETEEYGVSSVVFRRHDRPFHPGRLSRALSGFGNYATSVAAGIVGKKTTDGTEAPTTGAFDGVVRAKGQLWIASAHAHPINFQAAGRHMELQPANLPYLAAVPEEDWDDDDRKQHEELLADGSWHKDSGFGDRESEAIFIGVNLTKERILKELGEALLTDAELEQGPASWKEFEDVFFGGEYFEVAVEEDEEEEEEEEEEADEVEEPQHKVARKQ